MIKDENGNDQQDVYYSNCVVVTYATITPFISINDSNKDDYDSADCNADCLLCQSCGSSILINEYMITLAYGEKYWEQRLLCYDFTSNKICPSYGEKCKSASADCDIDGIDACLY